MSVVERPGATAPPDAPGVGRIRRLRQLPGGRAVVGGFLVSAATVGVFAAYLDAAGPPERTYVVAAADLPVGHVLEPADLGVVAADLPPALAEAAYDDPDEVLGAVTLAPVGRHGLVQRGQLGEDRADLALHEVSVPVPAAHALDGALRAGDRVDVLAVAAREGEAAAAVARDALVLAVGGGDGGLGARDDLTLTLGVGDGGQVRELAQAAVAGDLIVVRTPPGERGPAPGEAAGSGAATDAGGQRDGD